MAEPINVKKPPYNARGNGNTDDHLSIRNAIADAESQGGGIVYFPVGTYLICNELEYKSNLRFVGEHRDVTTIKLQTDSQVPVFNGTNRTNVAFENLTIDGNREYHQRKDAGLHGIRGRYIDGMYIYRCRIKNAVGYGLGLQIGGDSNPEPEKNIHLQELIIDHCNEGIDIKYGEHIHLDNVEVWYCNKDGVDIRGRTIFLTNVKALGNGGFGIECQGNGGDENRELENPPYFMLSNVYSSVNGGDGFAIYQRNSKYEGRVVLSSCISSSNKGNGFSISSAKPEGRYPNVTSLSSCIARNNKGNGIFAENDYVTVTGCQILGNRGWGFNNESYREEPGIWIKRNQKHVVVGNVFFDNKAGHIMPHGIQGVFANNITGP